MPDVTPKPLRSRANAIINLMGAVGGILYLGLAAVLYPPAKPTGWRMSATARSSSSFRLSWSRLF